MRRRKKYNGDPDLDFMLNSCVHDVNAQATSITKPPAPE